ncbi:MAG: GNAT family N-acetyltransferase [Ruminococcus sp.]|nr:GNAT family N-acetyltransferase [Ruminococcus sp.]
MIRIRRAVPSDLETVLQMRYETMRTVCGFTQEHEFSEVFYTESERYFRQGDQVTVLAWDGETAIGCASICYISVMPTFSHPSGKRAHIMNVYVRDSHRRQGIARSMLEQLIMDARQRCATQITLDATPVGRPLYESLGFEVSEEGMVINLT